MFVVVVKVERILFCLFIVDIIEFLKVYNKVNEMFVEIKLICECND